ncbi:MAG: hypothetical protein DWQ45_20015 [Planctomycetota bacterium]|nr:MAG: hypothetical protein DWQ41_16515 [Planctomycetota bacterium]REK31136.1 MAG: hypothetical protein DWQ45_20015 [Planctomycetota bacterium]
MAEQPHIAIIGAGPIGLEATLYATQRGYRVTLFERGGVASHVRHWGHVRLFSPFGMNSSEWGRAALAGSGVELPDADALLTGREFIDAYLQPLSELPAVREALEPDVDVLKVSRVHLTKGDLIGSPERGRDPFLLLVNDRVSGERTELADIVLDCSGVYRHHNWLGKGGIPCPGESDREYEIEYFLTRRGIQTGDQNYLEKYGGKWTLVVGGGYSAATSVAELAELANRVPGTKIVWVTRHDATTPIRPIEDDSLPERARLTAVANELALDESSPVTWIPSSTVHRLNRPETGFGFEAMLDSPPGRPSKVNVDEIIASVGYRPDRSLYEELQVHECYATQGPMKLAAKLLGETSADCLDQTSHGANVLRNPEPNFFILGAKSYGRNSNFLIRAGLQQIVDVFTLIERETTD